MAPVEPVKSEVVETPPAIDGRLFAWLDDHAEGRRFSLPIRIQRRGLGLATHVEDGGAGIEVTVDSSRLSRLLEDAVGLRGADPVVWWLAGTWGSALGERTTEPTFAVDEVVEPVSGPAPTLRWAR